MSSAKTPGSGVGPLCILLLVLAAQSLPTLAGASPISSGWTPVENLSNSPVPSQGAQSALNPASGELFVVWEEGPPGQEEIIGRRWLPVAQSWTLVENLSNSPWRDEGPALLFDRQGYGHLLWVRRYSAALGAPAAGTDLLWRYWDGTGWSDEEVLLHLDSFLPGAYGLVLAQTPDSVLLFVVWNGGFRQAEYRAGSWSELTPWDYSLGVSFAQVLVDGAGQWHVAAYGPNNVGYEPWFYDAYYLSHNETGWSIPLNLSDHTGVANGVGMAFDRQGRLHFLWSDPAYRDSSESLKSALWERVYDQGIWSPNTEVTTYNDNQAINGFSLTADDEGMLHLAWSEGIWVNGTHINLGIHYQTGDGTIWGPEEEVYTSAAESRYPVLAADSNRAAIVWREGLSADSEVYFSHSIQEVVRTYLPLIVKNKP